MKDNKGASQDVNTSVPVNKGTESANVISEPVLNNPEPIAGDVKPDGFTSPASGDGLGQHGDSREQDAHADEPNAYSVGSGTQTPKASTKSPANDEASFKATYNSLDALFSAKVRKFAALKSLAQAEAELSLSAVVAMLLGGVALFVVALTLWLLISVGLGIGLFYISTSLLIAVFGPIIINTLLAYFLVTYLRNIRGDIGLTQTMASLKGDS